MKHFATASCITLFNLVLPVQTGLILQAPVAKQDTVADPDKVYPLLQLYVSVPPNDVLVGVPGEPLEIEGGEPQSTAVKKTRKNNLS